MSHVIAGIGFIGFAAVSLLHVVTLYRIAAFHMPSLHWIGAMAAGLLWLAFLSLVARGMYYNRLQLPMGVVFGYGMIMVVLGMGVLDGVPATIGDEKWHDPANLLTPKTEFLLHNHSVVKRILSKQEYDLYSAYGLAYFSAGGMIFCAAASLGPLDRTGQLFQQRRLAVQTMSDRPQMASWAMTSFRCPACGGSVTVPDGDRRPPWCPHCGANLCV